MRSRRRGALAETKPLAEKGAKKPRKVASGQKEMLMPIAGKKPAKEAAAKKPTAKAQRKSA
jgi:DNA end-binding protein Ku